MREESLDAYMLGVRSKPSTGCVRRRDADRAPTTRSGHCPPGAGGGIARRAHCAEFRMKRGEKPFSSFSGAAELLRDSFRWTNCSRQPRLAALSKSRVPQPGGSKLRCPSSSDIFSRTDRVVYS